MVEEYEVVYEDAPSPATPSGITEQYILMEATPTSVYTIDDIYVSLQFLIAVVLGGFIMLIVTIFTIRWFKHV